MYRIKIEETKDELTLRYTLQEGWVRRFNGPEGFGIRQEEIWEDLVESADREFIREMHEGAKTRTRSEFKKYALRREFERCSNVRRIVTTSKIMKDLGEDKKYMELKEVVSSLIHMIDNGAELQPDSIIVQALRTGLND